MMTKTLCNFSNGITAMCDGADWNFEEQIKYCDGAEHKHSKTDNCVHLCQGERCDSHIAQDIAIKKMRLP